MRRRTLLTLMAGAPILMAGGTRTLVRQAPPIRGVPVAANEPILPGLSSDGIATQASLSRSEAYQGGAVRVSVDRAREGSAHIFGRSYPLEPAGEGLEGYVGLGVLDPPGAAGVSLEFVNLYGERETHSLPLQVLPTQWSVDYITIPPAPPPDPGAPPPPPPPLDETNLLPSVYAGLTPRKWSRGWQLPLPEPIRITGYFGEQRSFNGGPVQGHHSGTDFGADAGTPVLATNAGTVVFAGLYRIRGNLAVIDHGGGVMSLYGHMPELTVTEGQYVEKGQRVGSVGSTGLSTGPHLHWELAVSGVLVDGLRWTDGTQGF